MKRLYLSEQSSKQQPSTACPLGLVRFDICNKKSKLLHLYALNSGKVYKIDTSSTMNPTSAARFLPRTSPVLRKFRPGSEPSVFNTRIRLTEGSLGILWALVCLKSHTNITEEKYKFKLTQTCLSLPLCLNTDGCFCCAAAFQPMQAAKY